MKSNADIAKALVSASKKTGSPVTDGDGVDSEGEGTDGLDEATKDFGEAISSKNWAAASAAYRSMHDICAAQKDQSEEGKGDY